MTLPNSPLTSRPLSEPVARYKRNEVTIAQLLATARLVSESLPEYVELINLCGNRFHFLVYFCATLMARGKNILPPNRQPETIAALMADGCTHRKIITDTDLGLTASLLAATQTISNLEIAHGSEEFDFSVPLDTVIVEVFTSGSTGEPKKLSKTWRTLSGTGEKLCRQLDSNGHELWDLVATVPCQHMYGLETSVIMPLLGKFVCHDETPFYPQDVVQQIREKKRPVRLITTPVHLRAVVNSQQELPTQIKQVVSATAPLATELAASTERQSCAQVYEIFGFSEAGSVATRRTLDGPHWQLLPGFSLENDNPAILSGDHLPKAEHFPDNLEVIDATHFRFLSRSSDYMNIGGKRMSLNELQLKLLDLPGVQDAYLYVADNKEGRPTGFVVSDRAVRDIITELARVIDPVFLPRPLKKISRVARNATGKVTRVELACMLGESRS